MMLTGWMLYTFLVALAAVGLDLLATVYAGLKSNNFSFLTLPDFLKNILYYVVPLMVLSHLTAMDPTKVIVLIGYYVGGLAVIVKFVMEAISKFSK